MLLMHGANMKIAENKISSVTLLLYSGTLHFVILVESIIKLSLACDCGIETIVVLAVGL